MPRTVAYYHFLISPWSYLAIARLDALCEALAAAGDETVIDYLPIDVGRTFAEMGGTPPGQRHPSRQAFRFEELTRWSAHLGVPLNLRPAHFPADQTTAACMVHALASGHGASGADERSDGGTSGETSGGAGRAAARLSNAVLTAVWRDERDIADAGTLVELAEGCGLDGRSVLAAAAEPAVHERYEGTTRAAHERGVFGSPTWVLGEELFWGQDRMDFLARALGVAPPPT